jgi:zinc transporter ZupT
VDSDPTFEVQELILIGVLVGVVASVLLRIYFRLAVFPRKPKGPLFVLWWGFYVGVILVAAIMSSEAFEHLGIMKKLDKFEERLAYYLSWFVPVAITIGFSLFQVFKQRASRGRE